MSTWWLIDYTEPDIVVLPPSREDAPHSPTTMEPIREPPKKFSVGAMSERSPELYCSTSSTSLSRGDSQTSTSLDLYKRHQSLQANSYSNLLSAESGEKIAPKHSITPREFPKSGSATELLPKAKTSLTNPAKPGLTATRLSVPQITVNSHPTAGNRRLTQPNVESVGLVAKGHRSLSSVTTSRENSLGVTPLDGMHDSTL